MKNRIILVGKGGSGKDYLRELLENKWNLTYCTSHTSRPIREEEENGIDYYFVDRQYFLEAPDSFYEYVEFNGWFYGTSVSEFQKSDLLIMTPSGVEKLKPEDRKDSFIVYIDIDEKTRRERLKNRKDSDSAERRLSTDRSDFLEYTDFDMSITNPNFGDPEIMEILQKSSFQYYLKHFKK